MILAKIGAINVQVSESDPNLLINPDLSIDLDSSGVADDWTTSTSSGITANFAIDGGKQRVNITASTAANDVIIAQFVDCSAGDVFNFKAVCSSNGGTRVFIALAFFNGDSYISQQLSSQYADADSLEISLTDKTAPANTTRVQVRLFHKINTIGATGSAWFTGAELIKTS